MTRPILAAAILAALLMALPALAADGTATVSSYDGSSIKVGIFRPHLDTDMQADSSDGTLGTALDLERDLGLDDAKTVFWAGGTWRASRRQNVDFDYTNLSRSATQETSIPIVFNGETFAVDTTTSTHFNTRLYSLRYRYSFYDQPKTRIGAALGIGAAKLSAGISGEGPTGEPESESVDATIPLPEIGLKGSTELARNLFFNAYFNYMAVRYKGWHGNASDLNAGFAYMLDPHWGVELNYVRRVWDVSASKSSFTGHLDYTVSGAAVELRILVLVRRPPPFALRPAPGRGRPRCVVRSCAGGAMRR